MWRHLLIQSGERPNDLLSSGRERTPLLRFEALNAVVMPLVVPEEAWRHEDPNAASMVDTEWLL
jgi:hypothetical protein